MKSALLVGAALFVAHGCANPVEIEGDVLIVDPTEFGSDDAGVPPPTGGTGGAGGGSGTAGATGTAGGGAVGVATAGTGFGSSGGGAGGASSAREAAAGTSGLPINAGGTSAGLGEATTLGGAGGAAGGAAGAPGTAGTPGSAGTGAASVFDPAACDFQDITGCEDFGCLEACPANDSGSCSTRCQALITCVSTDPQCAITEADPLCAARVGGTAAACTEEADSAGGANTTQTTQPAFVARQFVQCICSLPRP